MRTKITYIADIHDESWSPKKPPVTDYNGKLITVKRHKIRENNRNKLFCKCGGSLEFKLEAKVVPITIEQAEQERQNGRNYLITPIPPNKDGTYGDYIVPNSFKDVTCPKCGTTYDNFNDAERLSSSKTFDSNISSVRFRVFENEKTLSLCCYATRLIVNHRTKNLILKDSKSSISINKKWRFATKIVTNKRGGQIVRRFGLQFISANIEEVLTVFSKIQMDRLKNDKVHANVINNEILSGMEEFCNRLLMFINPKDAEKLCTMFDENFSHKIRLERRPYSTKTIMQHKYGFIVEHKMPTILSTVIYPPIATVFFTKGVDFTLGLFKSWIIPRVSIIKKEMPTAPIEIIESFIRIKLLNDSMLRRRHEKIENKIKKEKEKEGIPSFGNERVGYYDARIPNNILPADKRLDFINISKKSYREMNNPESIELFMILVFQKYMSVEDAIFFINKYGIDVCFDIFKSISFSFFQDIGNYTKGDTARSKEIEHLMKLAYKFYSIKKAPENNIKKLYMFSKLSHSPVYISQPELISIYVDTLRTLSLLRRSSKELLETRSLEEVKTLHDNVYEEYLLVKDEMLNMRVEESMKQYAHMNCEIGNISFTLLNTVSELKNESHEMHHCVGTYSESVAQGKHVIFKILDSSDGLRATMSMVKENFNLNTSDNRFIFEQLKALRNAKASDNIKRAVIKFLKNNKIEIKKHSFSAGADLEIKNKNLEDALEELSEKTI